MKCLPGIKRPAQGMRRSEAHYSTDVLDRKTVMRNGYSFVLGFGLGDTG